MPRLSKSRRAAATLSLLLATTLQPLGANATTLVNSSGYESPAFNLGDLDGQQSWLATPGHTSTAIVQTDIQKSGQRAVRVDRASGDDSYWAVYPLPAQSGRYISIDWDMLVLSTGSTTALGPFFGVAAFDFTADFPASVATLGADASTGDILIQDGNGILSETALDVQAGVWTHFRIELDFADQISRSFVDGQLAATTEFIDSEFNINQLTDADITAISGNDDAASNALEGTAFFDNFIIRDGLRGDYNNDGFINAADYTVWRDSEGQSGFGLDADGDVDGDIDADDYDLWAAAFGDSNAMVSSSFATPEPASAAMMSAFLVAATAAYRRK